MRSADTPEESSSEMGSQGSNALMECEGCNNAFDQEERQPRILPCGHTFCTSCIGAILKDCKVFCLSCHVEHHAESLEQFPPNYDLESIMRASMMDVDTTPPLTATSVNPPALAAGIAELGQGQQQGLSKELLEKKKEKMKAIANVQVRVQATLNGLDQYAMQIAKMKDEHMKLMTLLEGLSTFHQERIQLLEEDDARLTELQAYLEDLRNNLNE